MTLLAATLVWLGWRSIVGTAHDDGRVLRYREVKDEVKGTKFEHRIVEIHAISMKRLSRIESTDDPSDGAGDE